MELCRSLRWKSFYGQKSFSAEDLLNLFSLNEVPYSCLQTCEAWGPDDDLKAPERCQPGRSCFEPSSRLRRAQS